MINRIKRKKPIQGRILYEEQGSVVNGNAVLRMRDLLAMGVPRTRAISDSGYSEKPVTLYVVRKPNGEFISCGREGHHSDISLGDYIVGEVDRSKPVAYSNEPVDVTDLSRRHGLYQNRDIRTFRSYPLLSDFTKLDPKGGYLREHILEEFTFPKIVITCLKSLLSRSK